MFYADLAKWGDNPACIAGGQTVSYQQLSEWVEERAAGFNHHLAQQKKLLVLAAENNLSTLVNYLAALRSNQALLLVDAQLSEQKRQQLMDIYQPNLLISGDEVHLHNPEPLKLDKRLALLLSTSGSTGSPKQVALSGDNLQANAASICGYLPIHRSDKTLTTLPFAYSYGLSVINSHLLAGACVVLNKEPVTSRAFWQRFEEEQISSLAGVPHSWDMLLRLGFTRKNWPYLRYFTQAGGKLDKAKVLQLAEYANAHNKALFVMYGQTEATARMAYLSPAKVLHKPESIGQAIPGGTLVLKDADGGWLNQHGQSGELCYQGANTMLGYAESQADLANFEPAEWLATGDLAYCDDEGDYFISGRLKRIIKPFGQRINLDEVEQWLQKQQVTAACLGNDQQLQVAVQNGADLTRLKADIGAYTQLHASAICIKPLAVLPLNANNKRDYQALAEVFAS